MEELVIRNQLSEIARVNERFNLFARRHSIPDEFRRPFNLVFDELLTNIISYGYDDDEDHEIRVGIGLEDETLTVSISDDARAFDPEEQGIPDTTLSVEERPVGGLGIYLVRNLMDEFSYRRDGGRNVVVLRKKMRD